MTSCTSIDSRGLLEQLQRATPFRHVEAVDAAHPRRAELETFVAQRYLRAFQARPARMLPTLLAFSDEHGRLAAVVGVRCAAGADLFVEQYLDHAADRAVADALQQRVSREDLVEVGNLAASQPGELRALVVAMTMLLDAAGVRWVLFAATASLRNACRRLGLQAVALAEARRERLAADGSEWGRYYDTHPVVVCGDLRRGAQALRIRLGRERALGAGDPNRCNPSQVSLAGATA